MACIIIVIIIIIIIIIITTTTIIIVIIIISIVFQPYFEFYFPHCAAIYFYLFYFYSYILLLLASPEDFPLSLALHNYQLLSPRDVQESKPSSLNHIFLNDNQCIGIFYMRYYDLYKLAQTLELSFELKITVARYSNTKLKVLITVAAFDKDRVKLGSLNGTECD
eukprot:g42583.t1